MTELTEEEKLAEDKAVYIAKQERVQQANTKGKVLVSCANCNAEMEVLRVRLL